MKDRERDVVLRRGAAAPARPSSGALELQRASPALEAQPPAKGQVRVGGRSPFAFCYFGNYI